MAPAGRDKNPQFSRAQEAAGLAGPAQLGFQAGGFHYIMRDALAANN
jgi:hypothetical protein